MKIYAMNDSRSNKKAFSIVYVVLFLLILLAPLSFSDLQGGGQSLLENKRLEKRPPARSLLETPKEFIQKFEAWFSDNIGFREFLIALHRRIFLHVLPSHSTYGKTMTLIGRDGHHFSPGSAFVSTLPVYLGKRPWLPDERMEQLAAKLNRTKRFLERRGIRFIVMFCADKESVYPEFYPESVTLGSAPTALDKVNEYISQNTSVDFFCIKERLLKEKSNYLLYPKTHGAGDLWHYNETGAFFAYQELMKHVNAYFPSLTPFSLDDVNITYLPDGASRVRLKSGVSFKRIDEKEENDARVFENQNRDLPTLLLMRDSYSYPFDFYLPQHFSTTISRRHREAEHLEEYVYVYKPDIVIFEVAERGIAGFTTSFLSSE